MQVGTDVHPCGHFARARTGSRPRWSAGQAGSPSGTADRHRQENHLGNWNEEEEEQCKAGDTGGDKERRPAFGTTANDRPASELKRGASSFKTPSEVRAPSRTEARVSGECRAPKVLPRVVPGVAPHQRPASLCRSLSVSEQEAKDAKLQSQKIAAQLTTPPSANSKGVLLFNKRKKRVNAFTLTSYGRQELRSGAEAGKPVDGEGSAPGDRLDGAPGVEPRGSADSSSSSEETGVPYFERRAQGESMEAPMGENHAGALEGRTEETQSCASEDEGEEPRGGGATEEAGGRGVTQDSAGECPLVSNDLVKPARATMEVHLETSHLLHEPDKVYMDIPGEANNQTDGGKISESQEADVPEEKQALVMNRTPKPFLSEGASPKPSLPQVSPPASSPYFPVYSNPPPVSRMTSPPPFASSSPSAVGQAKSPVVWSNKTGVLEESRTRRAARKPMFTFHEKPKVAPNPELLSLVQGIDVKKKSSRVESLTDEDYLGLGAEACTFDHQKAPPPVASKPVVSSQDGPPIPEWASCLKPPELRAPRRSGATQTLAEVKGKGAELFARRQSRMERYTIESSPASDSQPRPPSPTMSLPPSWKCHDGQRTPPPFNHRGLQLGPRPPPSAFAQVNKTNSSPRAPPDWARHQPHQLSSSLFIISPDKSPLTTLPRGAPSPPRLLPGATSYVRQTSAPPSSHAPPPTAAKPPAVPPPPSGLNGFGIHSPGVDLRGPAFQPASASPGSAPFPRPKEGTQAPRPSFSARRAGLEPQGRTSPITPPWKPSFDRSLSSPRTYLDTFRTQPASECRPGSPRAPLYPISPTVVSLPINRSPLREPKVGSPVRPGGDSSDSRRLKDLLAKNVVSAARRKKLSSPTASPTSPADLAFPLSPRTSCLSPTSPLSPSVASPPGTSPDAAARAARLPLKLYHRSLTDSEFSLGSDDSGPRSPSYYNFCPRGWTGSKLRQSDQL